MRSVVAQSLLSSDVFVSCIPLPLLRLPHLHPFHALNPAPSFASTRCFLGFVRSPCPLSLSRSRLPKVPPACWVATSAPPEKGPSAAKRRRLTPARYPPSFPINILCQHTAFLGLRLDSVFYSSFIASQHHSQSESPLAQAPATPFRNTGAGCQPRCTQPGYTDTRLLPRPRCILSPFSRPSWPLAPASSQVSSPLPPPRIRANPAHAPLHVF